MWFLDPFLEALEGDDEDSNVWYVGMNTLAVALLGALTLIVI